jgi:RND family efflux transporter MFP subunit
MQSNQIIFTRTLRLVAMYFSCAAFPAYAADTKIDDAKPAAKPALTVTVVKPQALDWPNILSANGTIAAWQEASVGAEANGLRLADVNVNVGDVVKKGQVLAAFAPETIKSDVAQSRAVIAEAEATLSEAQANAERARSLQISGMMSAQQINQLLTAERTAAARLESAKAAHASQMMRLAQTQLRSPDDGVISARMATVGAVVPAGQELFRLIRKNRLEWRAEVTQNELVGIKPGGVATLLLPGGERIKGKVRIVAPTIDPQTRNALVYVDLPLNNETRAGMFVKGEFELGSATALTLPQQALVLRDGFTYAFRLDAANKVTQVKVASGRRSGEKIEVLDGIKPDQQFIASGAAFLADGDTVRLAAAPATTVQSAAPAKR